MPLVQLGKFPVLLYKVVQPVNTINCNKMFDINAKL